MNLHSQESPNNNNLKKISIQSHISTASGETPGGKSQDSAAVKRGVTFKAGLIADKKHVAFCGPLLSIEEIKGSREKLTDIIFCKFYMGCHTEALGLPAERGYTQHNEEKLSEALQSCLTKYNKGTSQRIDLVFFKEAVHHAARLSRVLVSYIL
ncbi:unnamed protein product [Lymnaea stagnalis]|uniref:Uncharacterized protein n=1 Tax=Lymnaea stagnalis TaxID=6523 RepID=A0AAV2I782_LYMST